MKNDIKRFPRVKMRLEMKRIGLHSHEDIPLIVFIILFGLTFRDFKPDHSNKNFRVEENLKKKKRASMSKHVQKVKRFVLKEHSGGKRKSKKKSKK
ncbi:CLUMA_CG009695, isoform A [Clunio marinus]|uniref:CLUMA_CG009695, isoform A n=1 Tax=Clunio marinus TaxID=568069 RepID=A0A1J1ICV5_9DIPT|nr:CLUMA_CG009695, isoform A [Clunio marinus]